MATVLSFNAPLSKLERVPQLLHRLRWRVTTKRGQTITASWTPDVQYPSITRVLKEFAGEIEHVFVDALQLDDHHIRTLGRCPGDGLKSLSYKAMASSSGFNAIVGIDIRDIYDNMLLVLRDGTVYYEEPRKAKK